MIVINYRRYRWPTRAARPAPPRGCRGDTGRVDEYPVTDLAAYLAGRWRLDREIVDAVGARIGTFAGRADLTTEDAWTLRYHERGTLELGAHSGEATRALRYHLTDPGRADVHFDHGGFFHTVDLRDGGCRAEHLCVADLYRVTYRIAGPDDWSQEWTVTGPAKAHTIRSAFRRDSAC